MISRIATRGVEEFDIDIKYSNKRFLILGCGGTGISVANRLLKYDVASEIYFFDDKINNAYSMYEKLKIIKEDHDMMDENDKVTIVRVIEKFDFEILLRIDFVVVSPGIYYLPNELKSVNEDDICEIEMFLELIYAEQSINAMIDEVKDIEKDVSVDLGSIYEKAYSKSISRSHNEDYIIDPDSNDQKDSSENNEQEDDKILCRDIARFAKTIAFVIKSKHRLSNIIKKLSNDENYRLEISSDFDIWNAFFRSRSIPKRIAITGTNGKSTVTSLIYDILSRYYIESDSDKKIAMGGNIGNPCLNLPIFYHRDDVYVMEVSSYQIDLLQERNQFDIAICTNITPDHLDRYGTLERYAASKARLFHFLDSRNNQRTAIVSLNSDFQYQILDQLLTMPSSRVIAIVPIYDEDSENNINFDRIQIDGDNFSWIEVKLINKENILAVKYCTFISNKIRILNNFCFSVSQQFIIAHNPENIGITLAVALSMKVPMHIIMESVILFRPLPHRAELFFTWNIKKIYHELKMHCTFDINFINDSKSTNFDSAINILQKKNNVIWIAGGLYKGGEFHVFEKIFPNIIFTYCIGSSAELFADFLYISGKSHTKLDALQDIFSDFALRLDKILYELAYKESLDPLREGNEFHYDIFVILSPGCASLDQWKNFEERGNYFRSATLEFVSKYS